MNRAIPIAIATFASLILLNLGVFGFLSFGSLSEKMVTEKLIKALNEAQVFLRQESEREGLTDAGSTFLMRKLAVRLSSYEMIQAVLLVDDQGRVVGRREVRGRLTAWTLTERVPELTPPGVESQPTPSEDLVVDREFQPVFPSDMLTPSAEEAEQSIYPPGSTPETRASRMPSLATRSNAPVNRAGQLNNPLHDPANLLYGRDLLTQEPADGDSTTPRLAIEYNADALRREVDALRSELNTKLWFAIGISLLLLGAAMGYVLWAHRRNQSLRNRTEEAKRLAYLGTLASGLAHEIRNPLNAMNMNVQLIQEELEEIEGVNAEDLLTMLDSTRNEVHRLESMVSAFLSYSRPPDIVRELQSINDLVTRILKFLQPEIHQRGVILRTQLAPDVPPIPIDAGQMRQALINIIQNGLHVLQRGQHLDVETRIAGGDKVLVSIKDEGPGISSEELKNIFKVFYSTKRGGTGLGLATAQRIAESHHGGIKVESEVGTGSTFTFVLPMEIPTSA